MPSTPEHAPLLPDRADCAPSIPISTSTSIALSTSTTASAAPPLRHHVSAVQRTMSLLRVQRESSQHAPRHTRQGVDAVLCELEEDQERSTRVKLLSLMAIVLHVLGGALIIHLLEGWPLLDCVYFCIVTTTTVGYGDITPARSISKLFVVSYVIASIVLVGALLAFMVAVLLDQQEELLLAAVFRPHANPTLTPPPRLCDVDARLRDSSLSERIFKYTTGLDLSDYCALSMSLVWLVFILAVGITIFIAAERLSFVDALYATVISASTVGFGDFEPTHPLTKILMTFWLIFSTMGVVKVMADFTDASVKIKQRAVSRRLLTAQMDVDSLAAMDVNKDGAVDRAEFLSELLIRSGKIERREIDAIFTRFQQLDKDSNGCIVITEIRKPV